MTKWRKGLCIRGCNVVMIHIFDVLPIHRMALKGRSLILADIQRAKVRSKIVRSLYYQEAMFREVMFQAYLQPLGALR